MDAQIVIRLTTKLKNDFFEIVERKGESPSKVIRKWISTYVEEHSGNDEIQVMVEAGRAMQRALGGFKKSRFHGETLNRALKNNIDKFVHEVTAAHAQYEVHVPSQLLKVKDNPNLGYAYVVGLLSKD